MPVSQRAGAPRGAAQLTCCAHLQLPPLPPPLPATPATLLDCPAPPLAAQASVWEHSAVLTDDQQKAIDVISSSCSQRPMPKQLAAGTGGSGALATPDATPLPPTPLSPGSTDGAESSFSGTSFEDVTLQVGAAAAVAFWTAAAPAAD